MKKEQCECTGVLCSREVLILVLMEWRKNTSKVSMTLPYKSFNPCSNGMKKERYSARWQDLHRRVLILVLMEWRKNMKAKNKGTPVSVLILVLMEWRKNSPKTSPSPKSPSFNPCSNGMKKERKTNTMRMFKKSFNPCSNGMKKELKLHANIPMMDVVLILVLMEWRKNPFDWLCAVVSFVLILVLMEWRKNFSGLYLLGDNRVLILVLMEWRKNLARVSEATSRWCFNPCSNGMKKELATLNVTVTKTEF